MSNWIYGKELIEHWGIEDFELFGFLKKGFQPYNKHGRKVIDLDSSEWDRERTPEYYENLIRGSQEAGTVRTNSGPNVSPRLTEREIKQRGKELYESQTPKNSPYMSFSLPSNEKEATKAIASVKYFRFKKDEASKFAKKLLNKLSDCYQDLKLPELKVMAEGWANRFSVIKQITLYRADRNGKYVLDVRIDDSDKIEYREFERDWIDNACYLDRLRDAYITPNTDYYGEWLFLLPEGEGEPLLKDNHVLTDSRLVLFPRDDVDADNKSIPEKTLPFSLCESGTKWEDIKITLIDNDTVRIETPKRNELLSYHELRMSDKRVGSKPTQIWFLLKLFAKFTGRINSQPDNYDPKLPDTAKRLNKHLQNLFGIKDSIYKYHYKSHKAYITRIQFNDQTDQPPFPDQ